MATFYPTAIYDLISTNLGDCFSSGQLDPLDSANDSTIIGLSSSTDTVSFVDSATIQHGDVDAGIMGSSVILKTILCQLKTKYTL